MASIQDLYDKSEFAKLADSGKDKTPISADEQNKLHKDEKALANARGGKVKLSKYSDSVSR
tara:strand:- start:318 stop:500 length:183 start_codon:yes stop_codon:yes gene_type:complete